MMEDSEQITKIIFAVCINMALIRKIKKSKGRSVVTKTVEVPILSSHRQSGSMVESRHVARAVQVRSRLVPKTFFRAIDGHSSD